MAAGMILVAVALLAFLPGSLGLLFLGAACLGAGSSVVSVVQIPYIAEHTCRTSATRTSPSGPPWDS